MSTGRLDVGRIDKAHGLKGEVLVTLTTNRLERVDPGAELFATDNTSHDAADNLLLVVAESRPHQHRFLVRFEGYTNRNAAEDLRGLDLTADPIDDPDEIWVHDLIGARLVLVDGTLLGEIASVESNPVSDLLIIDDKRIVPLTFFVEIADDGTVIVDPPPGIFDHDDASDDEEE